MSDYGKSGRGRRCKGEEIGAEFAAANNLHGNKNEEMSPLACRWENKGAEAGPAPRLRSETGIPLFIFSCLRHDWRLMRSLGPERSRGAFPTLGSAVLYLVPLGYAQGPPAAAAKKRWSSLRVLYLFFLAFTLSLTVNAQAETLLREATTATVSRQAEIVRELQALGLDEFDAPSRRLLSQLLLADKLGARSEFVKLAGFTGQTDVLNNLPPEVLEVSAVRRALNLAKVRAGDTERRDNLLKNLRAIPVDDDFVYTVVPLLVYTRDREVFAYLWELVITENRNCHPADAETGGRIDCAYRIVEYLGTAINDFPVKIDEDHNLMTNDYAGALAEIRRWYAANRSSYTLLTDTY